MIPVGGPVREGVGLLGSPCFEIPRTVRSDHQFDHLGTLRRRRHRLKAKNRHNAATIGQHLLVRWLYVSGLVLVALLPFGGVTAPSGGATVPSGGGLASDTLATAAAALLDVAFTVGYFVLVERVVTGFRALRPRFCSIYQPAFWRARAVLEGAVRRLHPDVQRHAVQERRLAPAWGTGRAPGSR